VEKTFEIGQVVFVLSEEKQTVVPGIIVEEVMKKTMNGNSVSWKMKVGPPNKAEVFDTLKIKGEVYGTLEEVKVVMTQRLNEYIEKLATEAAVRVENWYGKEIASRQKEIEANTSTMSADDRIDPNSLIASIENPTQSQVEAPKFNPSKPLGVHVSKEQTIAHLKSMVLENETPAGSLPGEPSMFISGPNGERIPVNITS